MNPGRWPVRESPATDHHEPAAAAGGPASGGRPDDTLTDGVLGDGVLTEHLVGDDVAGDDDVLPDVDSIRMRQELRRRVRADHVDQPSGPGGGVTGGRHARRGAESTGPARPRLDYVPRHSVSTPGPSAVSASAATERFARTTEPSGDIRPRRPDPRETGGFVAPAGPNGVPGAYDGTGAYDVSHGGTHDRTHDGARSGAFDDADPGPATEPGAALDGTTLWARSGAPRPGSRGTASIGRLQPPPPVPLGPPPGAAAPHRPGPYGPGPGVEGSGPHGPVTGANGGRSVARDVAHGERDHAGDDYEDEDLEWRADGADVEDVVEWRAEGPATEIIERAAITGDTQQITTGGPPGSAESRAADLAERHEPDEPEEPLEELPPGKRVRVVLSQRKGTPSRPVRTVVDVQELTQVGELLSTSLIRSQLSLALRVGGIAAIALGAWPAIFILFPVLGRVELFGLRLPWLLLGVLAYPFMLGLGYLHARSAEKLEQVFADHIQN